MGAIFKKKIVTVRPIRISPVEIFLNLVQILNFLLIYLNLEINSYLNNELLEKYPFFVTLFNGLIYTKLALQYLYILLHVAVLPVSVMSSVQKIINIRRLYRALRDTNKNITYLRQIINKNTVMVSLKSDKPFIAFKEMTKKTECALDYKIEVKLIYICYERKRERENVCSHLFLLPLQ